MGCKSPTRLLPEKQASNCGVVVTAETTVDSGAAAVPDIKQHRRLLHVPVRMQSSRPFYENMSFP